MLLRYCNLVIVIGQNTISFSALKIHFKERLTFVNYMDMCTVQCIYVGMYVGMNKTIPMLNIIYNACTTHSHRYVFSTLLLPKYSFYSRFGENTSTEKDFFANAGPSHHIARQWCEPHLRSTTCKCFVWLNRYTHTSNLLDESFDFWMELDFIICD